MLVHVCLISMHNYVLRLAEKGYFVVGIELSETAAQQFFIDHKLDYNLYITDKGIIYEVCYALAI